ncbi:TRAP-type transport system, small permease component, predicted N-acetylneuraminate transporter [Planococcus halocryophilus Or1]|uniref:TRAP transporter small permease protein n=1 Tax=Planococcus halocryophilus TaxID=1215089 RepID=A0A1C7DT42_9BACL|nr:TRAP transporter small permease [Planococcus halocryophilus]ANU14572.1 TRAP transporter small permease protein [Planococcus halocryophilus]EMF46745.1 TRAP-type transport system, small permease component, predicted N-acetylneuraminate transporter [Planococcus halocryophilus Or1]
MKILRWLDRHIEEALLILFSTIMVAVIFLQVVMRQFNNSLSWSEELARYSFIWLIYMGISYGVKKERHIKVDVALLLLREKGKIILTIIANLLFVVFAVFVIVYGFDIANQLLNFGQKSPANQIPMGLVYMATPVGMGLTLIRLIQNLIKHIKALRGDSGSVRKINEMDQAK